MSRTLVLAEHRRGALREVSLEALRAGRALSGDEVASVLVGGAPASVVGELARHVSRVLHAGAERLGHYEPSAWTGTLVRLVRTEQVDAVILPHSYHGMDLAGRLAASLDWPLVTDVTALSLDEGRPVASRTMFGGRIAARVALPKGEPFVISVRPTAFSPVEPLPSPGTIESIEGPPEADGVGVRFLDYVEEAAGDVDISQAEIVVAVGRGIGEEENLDLVADLAAALGGVLACSRPIVDRGWLPRDRQVGTSGRTIRPKVYVAVGISGAFQHVAGMKESGRIIAINRDPHAPIFKSADYGIVGDLFDVVPALIQAARERGDADGESD